MSRKKPRREEHPYRAAPEAPKKRSFALGVVAAIGLLVGNSLFSSLVAMLSPILALFAGVIVGLVGVGWGLGGVLRPVARAASAMALLIAVCAVGVTAPMSGLAEALLYIPAESAPSAAADQGLATVFTLRGAVHHTEVTGTATTAGRRGGRGTRHKVYAVTDADWTPASPVPVWACCTGSDCNDPVMPSEARVATRVSGFFEGDCRRAIVSACAGGRCSSRADALVVSFGRSWTEVLLRRARTLALIAAVFALAWVAALAYELVKGTPEMEDTPR